MTLDSHHLGVFPLLARAWSVLATQVPGSYLGGKNNKTVISQFTSPYIKTIILCEVEKFEAERKQKRP